MATGPKKPVETAADGFVARWSKRKHAAGVIKQADASAPEPVNPGTEAPAAPAPILTDKDMPPIESLTEDSDFSGFFSPGVSEELRRLALNKLFHMPVFNTRCPLDSEYYDLRNMTPLGSIITHDMREEWAREAEKVAAAALDKALGENNDAAQIQTASKDETAGTPDGPQSKPENGGAT